MCMVYITGEKPLPFTDKPYKTLVQANLAIRNFLVALKLFLNAKSVQKSFKDSFSKLQKIFLFLKGPEKL